MTPTQQILRVVPLSWTPPKEIAKLLPMLTLEQVEEALEELEKHGMIDVEIKGNPPKVMVRKSGAVTFTREE